MPLVSCYKGSTCISDTVFVPKTFWQRAKGLLGKKQIAPEQFYLFYQCSSVHMFAMKFSIDLVYLNNHFEIVKLVHSLKPWQVSICLKAKHVIEIHDGMISLHGLVVGDKLLIKEAINEVF